jgi:hypothetical protein
MTDPMRALQAMLQLDAAGANPFPPSSRYSGCDTARTTAPDGRALVYLRRRFVPAPEPLSVVQEHTVVEGERLDNIAALYLGDPDQFWRLCDASGAMRPQDLTDTPGTRVLIALPQGMEGPSNA